MCFKRKPVNYMKLATKNTLIAVGNYQDRSVSIWSYEVLSLLGVLQMDQGITAMGFSDMVELMVVATSDGRVYMFRYVKKEHIIDLTLIHCVDLKGEKMR